jgi:hypothetical protein
MYGTSDTPVSIRLAKTFYSYAPTAVTASLSPIYFRYQSFNSDRQHAPPDDERRRLDDAPEHILFLVVDSLRPDHVPDLPIPFRQAVAPSTWTFPSVTSMLTGRYPHGHGAVAHTRPDDEEYALPRQVTGQPTVPMELEAGGYETYCGCAFLVPFVAIRNWFQTHRVYGDEGVEAVVSDYLSWRDGRDRTFGYLHLGDLHFPVRTPSEYLDEHDADPAYGERVNAEFIDEIGPCIAFDGCRNCRTLRDEWLPRYRAALDYVEDQLREVVSRLRDDTLVVITGDHGEGLGEHHERANSITDSRPNGGGGHRGNVGHGGTPFDAVARVPVGVSHPEGRSLLPTGGWASLRDLAPTLASEAVADPEITGQTWRTPIPEDRTVLCEGVRFGVERKAAYGGDLKVIRSEADDETFTARVDRSEPGERFLDDPPSDERDRLLAVLPDAWEDFDTTREVGPVVQDQLEALGYA